MSGGLSHEACVVAAWSVLFCIFLYFPWPQRDSRTSLPWSAVQDSDNYTCWARSSAGVDNLTHQVVALTPPEAPNLSLSHASHHALNLTVMPAADGGAPILGECYVWLLWLLT